MGDNNCAYGRYYFYYPDSNILDFWPDSTPAYTQGGAFAVYDGNEG
jgi:hypothetical protein